MKERNPRMAEWTEGELVKFERAGCRLAVASSLVACFLIAAAVWLDARWLGLTPFAALGMAVGCFGIVMATDERAWRRAR